MPMPLTFPLSLGTFADLLPIESVIPNFQRNDQISGLENGQIIAAEIAPPLRTLTVSLRPMSYDDDAKVSALIESLDGSIGTFYMCQAPRLYPQADPKGSIIGAINPTIGAINADNKRIVVYGLPVGYVLTQGDFISFNFGAGGAYRAFHRILQTGAANSSGQLEIELRPHLNVGVTVGTIVTIKKPSFKAIIIPNSLNEGTIAATKVTGKSFQIIQRY